ncbi:phage holin family protein [Alkalibacillus almallahensis]|uniref:phage holin family protein n=1 Tax=Alkalibacillus almallahensis TaxID=1379154 RepID=UPI00141FA651|nr:phage holin family protein [Alkalibacillus almallahensis]NIK13253.1 NhaP-type Na+/H+ or K+/H+ antiporter [Alkalibacillus almallahensis]
MEILDYVMDEAFVLIPVLWILGKMIKQMQLMPNRFIPITLLGISTIFTTVMMGLSVETFIQAILVTGAAVFGHQLWKQFNNHD